MHDIVTKARKRTNWLPRRLEPPASGPRGISQINQAVGQRGKVNNPSRRVRQNGGLHIAKTGNDIHCNGITPKNNFKVF